MYIWAYIYVCLHHAPILKGKNMIELFIKSGTSSWYKIDKNQSKIWTMWY